MVCTLSDSAWSDVRPGKVHQTLGDALAAVNNVSWRVYLKLVSFFSSSSSQQVQNKTANTQYYPESWLGS